MFNIGAVIIVFAFLLIIILLAVQLCRMPYLSDGKPRIRLNYILLALFAGVFGIHDFYAGYTNRGILAFILTLTWFGSIISAIMALYDIATVTHDAAGVRFKE